MELKVTPEYMKELVVGNKIYRATFDFRLTEADVEKARRELKETEEVRKSSLRKIKELILNDGDFQCRADDAYLIRYLRHQKFDCDKAYNRFRKFYRTRNENPELFITTHLFGLQGDSNVINMLPYRCEDGSIICLHRFGDWNLDEMGIYDLLKIFITGSDCISLSPQAQINGMVVIFDFGGLTARHVTQIFSSILTTMKVMQDIYPFRVKRIIVFNCGALLRAGWASIRWLIKQKIANRLVLLRSDVKEIHKYVNPDILPKEYGGCLEDEECYKCAKTLVLNNIEYLKYEQSFVKHQ